MELVRTKRLGEQVGNLPGTLDVDQFDLVGLDEFAQKRDTSGDVLEPLAVGGGFGQLNSCLVVAEQVNRIEYLESEERCLVCLKASPAIVALVAATYSPSQLEIGVVRSREAAHPMGPSASMAVQPAMGFSPPREA